MIWPDCEGSQAMTMHDNHNGHSRDARIRLSRDLLNGRYRKGEPLRLTTVAREYDLDCPSAFNVLADLHSLGMVVLSGPHLALVRSTHPKEMYEAYAIRAALEEIGGRAAVGLLKGNTAAQQRELEAMRARSSQS